MDYASASPDCGPDSGPDSGIEMKSGQHLDPAIIRSSLPGPGTDTSYFVERDGKRFAGIHLIVDLWGATRLDDEAHIEATLRDCVKAAGATLLHIHLHRFEPNGGISGVAVLAESHISVHSWPETGYAAFDIFTCGDTTPLAAVDVLRDAFAPERVVVGEHLRGQQQ